MANILLYMGYKKETFYIKNMENIMDIFVTYQLDPCKYTHISIKQFDTTPVYFICQKDQTHFIYFNNEKIEIPIDMNVGEFQKYVNLYNNIFLIENENYDNNIKLTPYFSDETFTTNNKYTSDTSE
jgi:hypothetical protein